MSLLKTILIPSWLQKLDRYLLLHKPFLWSVKLHYVLYHVLLVTALAISALGSMPLSISEINDPTDSVIGFSFFVLIGFLYWCYVQQKHISEYFFIQSRRGASWQQVMALSSVLFLFAVPSMSVIIQHEMRVRSLISKEELAKDLTALNNADVFIGDNLQKLHSIGLPLKQTADSLATKLERTNENNYSIGDIYFSFNYYKPHLIQAQYIDRNNPKAQMASTHIYVKDMRYVLRLPEKEQIQIIEAFYKTLIKYNGSSFATWPEAHDVLKAARGEIEVPQHWEELTRDNYAQQNLIHLIEAHNWNTKKTNAALLWTYLCVFLAILYGFGLLIFTFRLLTWRQFLGSCLVSLLAMCMCMVFGYGSDAIIPGAILSVLIITGFLGFKFKGIYTFFSISALTSVNFWSFVLGVTGMLGLESKLQLYTSNAMWVNLILVWVILHATVVLPNIYRAIQHNIAAPTR
ncbi:MAG: hypothetical protein EAZ57_02700 [Cytophagales bacterium]|nr:MAG: hypothetical protein EAZ67_03165 [Cytophagales bacterium]TAF61672.1 MAG: hypothetical protein EAZ57_02700 [Cytophagales bacterium]